MRNKIFTRIVIALLCVIAITVIQQNVQMAQSDNIESKDFRSLQGDKLPENTVYEQYFRMVNLYDREADKQEIEGFSERASSLRTYFQRKIQLDNEQIEKIKEAAREFQKDIDLMKESKGKIENSIEGFNDTENLAELKQVYNQRGQLWSKHRDSLQQNLGKETFK